MCEWKNEWKIIFVFLYIYNTLYIKYVANIYWKWINEIASQTFENYKAELEWPSLCFWPLLYYTSLKVWHDINDNSQLTRTFTQPNYQLSSITVNKGKCTVHAKRSITKEFCQVPNVGFLSFLRAEVVPSVGKVLPSSPPHSQLHFPPT